MAHISRIYIGQLRKTSTQRSAIGTESTVGDKAEVIRYVNLPVREHALEDVGVPDGGVAGGNHRDMLDDDRSHIDAPRSAAVRRQKQVRQVRDRHADTDRRQPRATSESDETTGATTRA